MHKNIYLNYYNIFIGDRKGEFSWLKDLDLEIQ